MTTATTKENKKQKKEISLDAVVYDSKGKESSKLKLPAKIFGLPWNADLVHQVAVSYASNKRTPVADTKDRGDVRGGGKKPWRQKGTGRARHGSRRSPIWRGGGITFGPTKERNFKKKINAKMKSKALFVVLSKKWKDGDVMFVDEISLKNPKTKDAKSILKNLSSAPGFGMVRKKKNNSASILLPEKQLSVSKSFANFSNLNLKLVKDVNVLDLLDYKYVILVGPEKSLKFLESKVNPVRSRREALNPAFAKAKPHSRARQVAGRSASNGVK